ncbi:MAG: MarR family transcriptional regulator [Clostridiales bacterium]|jgi:DNA-binding MarR family transcriptional regulator|nr:MarR family transcriptional regulator [Clostridiales bacterium]
MQIELKELGMLIDKLALLRRVSMGRIFQSQGLHFGQLRLLEFIIANDGCTQVEVADYMGVSPASVALSTKRLSKAGMIEKRTDKNNLRRNILKITPKGLEVTQNCRKEFDLYDKRLFAELSDEESVLLFDMLGRLLEVACEGKELDMRALIKDMREMRNKHGKQGSDIKND